MVTTINVLAILQSCYHSTSNRRPSSELVVVRIEWRSSKIGKGVRSWKDGHQGEGHSIVGHSKQRGPNDLVSRRTCMRLLTS